MMRLMPWGFDLAERNLMANQYKDIIENLKELYVLHVYSRLRVDNDELSKLRNDADYIQSDLDFKMLEAMHKVVRRTTSEDPRVLATIYENDIFVIIDPSAFFKQLDKEFENAYQVGLENGKRFAERHGWKRVMSDELE